MIWIIFIFFDSNFFLRVVGACVRNNALQFYLRGSKSLLCISSCLETCKSSVVFFVCWVLLHKNICSFLTPLLYCPLLKCKILDLKIFLNIFYNNHLFLCYLRFLLLLPLPINIIFQSFLEENSFLTDVKNDLFGLIIFFCLSPRFFMNTIEHFL